TIADSATDGLLRGTTPASTIEGTTRRSAKISDPPLFYNNKDKDTITFNTWIRQVENKLDVNHDHYENDRARQSYIEFRLAGKASYQLEPYLEEAHPNQIKTSASLIAWLKNEFRNVNRAEEAIEEFEALRMKPGDEYHSFRNEFVRLAGECRKTRSEWKKEFKRRLLPIFQDKLIREYIDDTVDFELY
ncbi:hypothetical protein B0T26DRAFT_609019, partial [Lasiosphaeria miniovina]